jgi:hypothetical protein
VKTTMPTLRTSMPMLSTWSAAQLTGPIWPLVLTSPVHSPDMVARLQATCQCTLSEVAKTDIADSVHTLISEQEFTDALDHLQKNRAPGPSMGTTNMIRAWSPNTRHTAFVLLDILWKNKEVPKWWADGVLCPILKKPGDTTLQNMRLIGRLEVIRKVWTGIIIRRI